MKGIFKAQTLIVVAFVILITVSFGYAESVASSVGNFPWFHVHALLIGGLIIASLKERYSNLYLSEAIGSFALYAVLITLFTAPVINALKAMVG